MISVYADAARREVSGPSWLYAVDCQESRLLSEAERRRHPVVLVLACHAWPWVLRAGRLSARKPRGAESRVDVWARDHPRAPVGPPASLSRGKGGDGKEHQPSTLLAIGHHHQIFHLLIAKPAIMSARFLVNNALRRGAAAPKAPRASVALPRTLATAASRFVRIVGQASTRAARNVHADSCTLFHPSACSPLLRQQSSQTA